jgi:translation initiation factor IF-2
MEPAVAPPPPDQQRRPGDKRGRPQRDRTDIEEKILRPTTRRPAQSGPPPVSREITISEGITVKELSERLDVKASVVIKRLLERNIPATINQTLDSKLAA